MAYSEKWAEVLRAAIGNRSQRAIAKKAGVSQTYVGNMLGGIVPSRQVVLAIAKATGGNPEEFLKAAGYGPPFNSHAALFGGLAEIARRTGKVVPFEPDRMILREDTAEEVRRILREIENDLEDT